LSSVKAYKGELLTLITVEKVPKKRLEAFRNQEGDVPCGVTLSPKADSGFRKLEVMIQEKMSREKTRIVLAHELFHCLQHLCGCEMDEESNNDIDVVMAAALKEKRKVKK
jgi:Zn-dependent peptidase ImmA (M78 family)